MSRQKYVHIEGQAKRGVEEINTKDGRAANKKRSTKPNKDNVKIATQQQ